MRKSSQTSSNGIKNGQTHNRSTQKTKTMSNTVIRPCLLIRHQPCSAYSRDMFDTTKVESPATLTRPENSLISLISGEFDLPTIRCSQNLLKSRGRRDSAYDQAMGLISSPSFQIWLKWLLLFARQAIYVNEKTSLIYKPYAVVKTYLNHGAVVTVNMIVW